MEPLNDPIAKIIRAMADKGLSGKDLVRDGWISRKALQNIICRQSPLSPMIAVKLADVLAIPIEDLSPPTHPDQGAA